MADVNYEVVLVDEGRKVEHRGIRYSKRTVTIDRKWHVVRDGNVIGTIEYQMLTREQRTPGRMYVNKRWQSPGWTFELGEKTYTRREAFSKKYAIDRILEESNRG